MSPEAPVEVARIGRYIEQQDGRKSRAVIAMFIRNHPGKFALVTPVYIVAGSGQWALERDNDKPSRLTRTP